MTEQEIKTKIQEIHKLKDDIREVEGVKSRKDAINTLQIMLDDFDDMNSESNASVCINWDKVEKEK